MFDTKQTSWAFVYFERIFPSKKKKNFYEKSFWGGVGIIFQFTKLLLNAKSSLDLSCFSFTFSYL